MKALYIEKHGPIDDLKVSEVPRPSIGANDVLVKVEAAGINPSDLASVQGKFPGSLLPRIVGRDFAGTVVEGSAGLIGTEIWGTGGDFGVSRNGTHAEYLAIPTQAVAPRPTNLSIEAAAGAGVPFVTAFSALVRLGKLQKDEWVIVSGAAGAVGQAAIQIAHSKGAHVVALVKDANERNSSVVGQVEAISQSDQNDLNSGVRAITGGRGANLALNGVGSSIFGNLLDSLAIGGRQIVYSVAGGREFTLDLMALYKNQFTLLGLDTQKLNATDCAHILNELTPLFESGALNALPVGKRFPLSDAPRAYSLVAAGQSGKVVLTMAS